MGQTVQFGHFLGLVLFGLSRDLVSESSRSLLLRLTGSRERQFSSANVNTEKRLRISPWQQLTRGPQRTPAPPVAPLSAYLAVPMFRYWHSSRCLKVFLKVALQRA